ncbi:MAG: S8 family serine peptidase [Candidatus Hatepunaea meridiana]|nr:S8 family serine peptidase [Candidatus Hatepunaea meridiana]
MKTRIYLSLIFLTGILLISHAEPLLAENNHLTGNAQIMPLPPNSNSKSALTLPANPKPSYPKLESALSKLVRLYNSQQIKDTRDYARIHDFSYKDDRVLVELTLCRGHLTDEIDLAELRKLNIEVESKSTHFICVWSPVNRLVELAEKLEIVSLIHRPLPAISDVTSEGVALMGADDFHNGDITGEGVTIAIVDLGFNRHNEAVEAGELPEEAEIENFTDVDFEEGSVHGSACAEIVYDLVPDAEFYLTKVYTDADLEEAIDYLIEEEVDIISMSLGWPYALYDYFEGTDPLSEKVNEAFESGIMYVNSAGNHAETHYRAEFDDQDNDSNDFHHFSDDDWVNHFGPNPDSFRNLEEGTRIWVSMSWDDFPESGEDFNLYLFYWNEDDEEWETVAESENTQNGDDTPFEYFSYQAEADGAYGIGVFSNGGHDGIDFTIFTSHDLGYRTLSSSLGIPAVAEHNFAVGAINHQLWGDEDPQLESFSSRGPTNDGRLKPEISGMDAVTSWVYNNDDFYGTSAACPHVAGAAALILCSDLDMVNEDLWEYLTTNAEDIGDEGQDNLFGYGLLRLEYDPDRDPMIINVPDDYETIQAAIEASIDGDTVLVSEDEYQEYINFNGRDIIVASNFLFDNDEDIISETTIFGDEENAVVTFNHGETDAELIGFTISNGYRGIHLEGGCRPTISYCNIVDNANEEDFGAGIYCLENASPTIDHCLIAGNTSAFGAGFTCHEGGSPNIVNCTFSHNDAGNIGDAVFVFSGSELTIVNSIFWHGEDNEIGFHQFGARPTLNISYSDVQGGRDHIVNSNRGDINWGEGMIEDDPLFVSPDDGDFHLTEDSPCIDTGDPDSPEDPDGTRADMGRFYFEQEQGDPPVIIVDPQEIEADLLTGDTEEFILNVINEGGRRLVFEIEIDITSVPEGAEDLNWVRAAGDGEVEPDADLEFIVVLDATGAPQGDYEAELHFLSNDPETPDLPVSITLHVTGAPHIEIEWSEEYGYPDLIDFGFYDPEDPFDITIDVRNAGFIDLDIEEISIEGDHFSVEPEDLLLEPDESSELTLTFEAEEDGVYEASLYILSNDPDNEEILIPIHAIVGEPPIIDVDPEEFELDLDGGGVWEYHINVSNLGGWDLVFEVELEIISEPEGVDLNWIQFNPYEGEIEPDHSSRITVILDFTDEPDGEYEAEIHFLSNDPITPDLAVSLLVHVTGVPRIEVEWSEEYGYPDLIDFGFYDPDNPFIINFEVRNEGAQDLEVDQITIPGNFFSADPSQFVVGPEDSYEITLSFNGEENGVYEAIMSIISNDPHNGEVRIPLRALIGNNRPPEVRDEIADQRLNEDFEPFLVADLSVVFRDPEGAELEFQAESDEDNLIVEIGDFNRLWLSVAENWSGSAVVTVFAEDDPNDGRDLGPVRDIQTGRLDNSCPTPPPKTGFNI